MADNNQYWEQLIAKGLRSLQEQNNDAAADVLRKAAFDVEHSYHDSWRWGTDYWALVLYLKNRDYMALGDKKDQVERDVMSALVTFQKGSRDLLSTVSIRPSNEQDPDWKEALPFHKTAEAAELFIREGRYDSAIDCIDIAFSDYIRQLLTEHDLPFKTDDSLAALFAELHGYYCSHIRPADAGDRIEAILQNAGEIIDTINEMKNDTATVHSDGQRIGKREAQLFIGLASSIVDYIEDVEKELWYTKTRD